MDKRGLYSYYQKRFEKGDKMKQEMITIPKGGRPKKEFPVSDVQIEIEMAVYSVKELSEKYEIPLATMYRKIKQIKEGHVVKSADENKKILSEIYVTPEKFAECIDSVFSNCYGYIAELNGVEPKRENITVDMLLDWFSQKGIGCADAYGFLNSFYEKIQ